MLHAALSSLLRIDRHRRRALRKALAPCQYVGTMHLIVRYISRNPGASQEEIACFFALDKASAARDAKRLVQLQKIPRTATLAQVIIERNRDVHFTYDFNQDTWQRGQRQNPICL